MDYRDAINKAVEIPIFYTDRGKSIIVVADAIMAAYEAGRAERDLPETVTGIANGPMHVISDQDWCTLQLLKGHGHRVVSVEEYEQFVLDRGDRCKYVDIDFYALLLMDKSRMDYIRKHAKCSPALMTLAWTTDIGDGFDERLDAAIKQEAGEQ